MIESASMHGRKDLAGTKSAVLSSYVLVLTICLCTFGGITLFREQIVHLYNDSEMIVSTASVLLILAAAYQLPDCLQVLSVGVLRGFRDTASITVITFFSYCKQIDKVCADVEVQAGMKPYWFKVDENGELAGGVAKFLQDKKAALTEALGLKPGCLVGVTAGKKGEAQKTAGVMRKMLGAAVPGHMDKERYEFCWIVDFPMYEIGEESGELEFCHNPFSMPSGIINQRNSDNKGGSQNR